MLGMLTTRIAVIPAYASDMIGSLYVPVSATRTETKPYFSIEDKHGKVYLETQDSDQAYNLQVAKARDGIFLRVVKKRTQELGEFNDVGDRCTQGVVKYIGPDVKEIKRGDYVLFSGYTGTLIQLEDEGVFIIMEEKFVMAICAIDKFIRVPGLYIRTRNQRIGYELQGASAYDYHEVTYEVGMNLLVKAITDSGNLFKVNAERPSLTDYDEGA